MAKIGVEIVQQQPVSPHLTDCTTALGIELPVKKSLVGNLYLADIFLIHRVFHFFSIKTKQKGQNMRHFGDIFK